MGLNKKDRRISIWIGVIIGVTLSSMLFRYAIKDKNERSQLRLGSYDSNITAIENLPFPPVPSEIRKAIPSGLVLYYEGNQSVSEEDNNETDCWIIESSGALRSERLFLLAEIKNNGEPNFFRASEIYVAGNGGINESILSSNYQRMILEFWVKIKELSEFILQIKEFSPSKLRYYLRNLPSLFTDIIKVRLYPWSPNQ